MREREAFSPRNSILNATRNREKLSLQSRFYTPPPRLTMELREVSAALYHLLKSHKLYNLLKSHKARPMSASIHINRLQLNDELLETNLSTTLQTGGMTQFWFKKKKLQVHGGGEFGSCAEYHSHDTADYLKTVNNVPEGYDLGKL